MFDNVVFFNWFGNGDVFNNREFVRDLMTKIPAKKFWYAHAKNPRLLEDIEGLEYSKITPLMEGGWRSKLYDNDLYINTWIGLSPRHVLPGIGCTLENYYVMYSELLHDLNISFGLDISLDKDIYKYIPTVDYTKLNPVYLKRIDDFVENHTGIKVLISNGDVQSNQAENFDMTPPIKLLANAYNDITFILTSDAQICCKDNVFFTKDIIKADDGCDLNEISYLSTFCDMLVGRSSSPYTFCLTKENLMDKDKIFVAFSYSMAGSFYIHNNPTPSHKVWTRLTDVEGVIFTIKEAINQWVLR